MPVIVATIPNRAGEVGLACLLEDSAELQLSHVIDTSHAYRYVLAELLRIRPDVILLLDTHHTDAGGVNRAVQEAAQLGDCAIKHVGRRTFDDTAGSELLRKYCAADEALSEAQCHYLAVGCAGAILQLVTNGQLAAEGALQVEPRSLRLTMRPSSAYCQMGLNTILSLGVIADNRVAAPQWSLYSAIAPCVKTKAGARLLRASLLQPLVDVPTITERQNAIAELHASRGAQQAVQEFLAEVPADVGRCLAAVARPFGGGANDRAALAASSAFIQSVLRLRNLLLGVYGLAKALEGCTSALLTSAAAMLSNEDLQTMLHALGRVIDDDAEVSKSGGLTAMQMCCCVKPGVDQFLDGARAAFSGLTEDLQERREEFELPDPNGARGQLVYSKRHGWHLAFPRAALAEQTGDGGGHVAPAAKRRKGANGGKAQLPSGCWELSSTKTKVLCMSDAVATWNLRIEEAAKECQVLTTQLLLGLREELLSRRPAICALLDTLALLDFLSGYVAYMHAQKEHAAFCRPVICAQTGVLSVTRGFHPMHGGKDVLTGAPVAMRPNDVTITSLCNLQLLFGPNSSGKSTLLKQTGLLCVLAQAGVWVPAAEMCLHPFTAICTRMSMQDAPQANGSSLTLEAQDAAEVLRAASPTALVLVDELGKATSSTDGLAFAWAVAEALLATHCLTLFATHFGELSRLGGMYAAASVLHMEALDDGESYKQTHRCVAGPCEVSLYGLKLAKKAGVPDAVTQHAFTLANQLGRDDADLFPAAPGCDARRGLLRELQELVLVVAKSGGDGGSDAKVAVAAAKAQACLAELAAAAN